MKRCPQCSREYDTSMMFCLDDGAELLYGPASGSEPPATSAGEFGDGPRTAILHSTEPQGDAATRAQIFATDQTAAFPSGIAEEPKPRTFDKRLLLAPI